MPALRARAWLRLKRLAVGGCGAGHGSGRDALLRDGANPRVVDAGHVCAWAAVADPGARGQPRGSVGLCSRHRQPPRRAAVRERFELFVGKQGC